MKPTIQTVGKRRTIESSPDSVVMLLKNAHTKAPIKHKPQTPVFSKRYFACMSNTPSTWLQRLLRLEITCIIVSVDTSEKQAPG